MPTDGTEIVVATHEPTATLAGGSAAPPAMAGALRADDAARVTEVWPGRPFPLGPTWDGDGVNFSLFSEHAERVELCLFDDDGARDTASRSPSAPATTGTATCPASRPGSATATACTVRTSPRRATGSTRPSC